MLNIVATYGIPRVKRAAKQALCGEPLAVCAGDRLLLRVEDGDGGGGLTAVEMVKYMAVETRT